jgi:hypothetical protein
MTKTGISLLINRSPAADATIRALADAGKLQIAEVTTEEIKESQTRRVVFGDFAYAYTDFVAKQGKHVPVMIGPNRDAARLSDEKDVAFFRAELERKLELQWAGRYRYLWGRKATKELRRFLMRYVEWFLVRVVKIKSLLGRRQEVSKEKISIFR